MRTVTYAELEALTNRLANGAARTRRVGRATPSGCSCRWASRWSSPFYAVVQDRRDRRADLLRLRRPRRGRPAGRRRRSRADHRRRRSPPRQAGRDEGSWPTRRWPRRSGGAHGDRPRPAGHRAADAGRAATWRGRSCRRARAAELDAPALDPETPMMVIYTSGTTGRPKGAVHVHGGFLVKIAQECAFQTDVHAGRPVHLDDRHGLDHGAEDRGRRRGAGRHPGALGGRAGLPRPGPDVGAGRAAPDQRAGRVADADPRAARRTATSR